MNENQYLEKSILYNSVSIFALIENVDELIFNFSGKSYKANKRQIEEFYPNYENILSDEISKNNFNKYLEDKMNDNDFVETTFNKIFDN